MTFFDLDDIAYQPNLNLDEHHHTRLSWNKELKATFNALLCGRLATAKELEMSSKTRKPTKHKTKPWFTKICVLLKKCCRCALSEWKRSNHNCDLQNYIFLRQNFIRATEQAKQSYFHNISNDLINSGSKTAFWQAVKRLLPSRASPLMPLDMDRVTVHLTDLFNIYKINSALPSPHQALILIIEFTYCLS